MLEEGSANVVILKKIIIVTQLLQMKSTTKPTNKKGLCALYTNFVNEESHDHEIV